MARSAYVSVLVRQGSIGQCFGAMKYLQQRSAGFPDLRICADAPGFSAEGWWYGYPCSSVDCGLMSRTARGMVARALAHRGCSGLVSVVPWDEGRPAEETSSWPDSRIPRNVYTSFQPSARGRLGGIP